VTERAAVIPLVKGEADIAQMRHCMEGNIVPAEVVRMMKQFQRFRVLTLPQ